MTNKLNNADNSKTAMYFKIYCTEMYDQTINNNADFGDLCSNFDSEVFGFEDLTFETPTLILNGRVDPATPVHEGERLHQKLPNSTHFIVDNGSHGVFTNEPCAMNLVLNFLSDTPTEQGTCGDDFRVLSPSSQNQDADDAVAENEESASEDSRG